jgi:hypothetical protein
MLKYNIFFRVKYKIVRRLATTYQENVKVKTQIQVAYQENVEVKNSDAS